MGDRGTGMKLLLVVISFLTVQAHAESDAVDAGANTWYAVESRSCSSGEEFVNSEESSTTRYQISEDLSQLTIENVTGDVTEKRMYSLTLFGKNAYLASPLSGGDESDYFFVSTGDIASRLLISTSDRTGERCQGGLIQTSATVLASHSADKTPAANL
jgi:hypothetical protein